jgi:hypothetical protein
MLDHQLQKSPRNQISIITLLAQASLIPDPLNIYSNLIIITPVFISSPNATNLVYNDIYIVDHIVNYEDIPSPNALINSIQNQKL